MTTDEKKKMAALLEVRSMPEPNSGCTLWARSLTTNGYGQFRGRLVHRLAYEVHVGPIPDGLSIDHLCRNRACLNWMHLEPVTHRENVLRGNAPPAHRARQVECIHGHLFDEANTYIKKDGNRLCLACHRESSRRTSRAKSATRQAVAS